MKNTVLFCTGLSGSGKSYFAKNTLPSGLFYNLRSLTTRPMRQGESDGNPYFFVDETEFERARLVTRLWVNEAFWAPGKPKWLYGVPESEVLANLNRNLLYDVIQPKYAKQLIDWFKINGLSDSYNFRVAYFLPPANSMQTVAKRANMPDDIDVRRTNTCDPIDFLRAGLDIDYILQPRNNIYSPRLQAYIKRLQHQK
jgi:guanylate kinase